MTHDDHKAALERLKKENRWKRDYMKDRKQLLSETQIRRHFKPVAMASWGWWDLLLLFCIGGLLWLVVIFVYQFLG